MYSCTPACPNECIWGFLTHHNTPTHQSTHLNPIMGDNFTTKNVTTPDNWKCNICLTDWDNSVLFKDLKSPEPPNSPQLNIVCAVCHPKYHFYPSGWKKDMKFTPIRPHIKVPLSHWISMLRLTSDINLASQPIYEFLKSDWKWRQKWEIQICCQFSTESSTTKN